MTIFDDEYDPHFYHPFAELFSDDSIETHPSAEDQTDCWCCDDTGTSYQGLTPCPCCHRAAQETAS